MKIKFVLTSFVAMLFMVVLSSCGSNSEMEKKLDGKWECTKYEEEDGMTMKMTETITYNYSESGDNTFKSTIKIAVTSPVYLEMGKVTYSGTWTASSDKLMGEIDKNSINFSLSSLLDASDKREFEKEFKSELKNGDYIDGGKILSVSEDELKLQDEEDHEIYNYKRIN
ncbi:MAG: hypothetical protein K2M31_02770 [Muribaculaceae bacterium]|nr:hypothetical protein [Muribaculaceae bacterium]